jgi:hypothetical protein
MQTGEITTMYPDGTRPGAALSGALTVPVALGARVANLVMQAQVQFAYACAEDARERAQRSAALIEASWPNSPMREVLLGIYRAQADSAATAAGEVLANARRRCGLAFARSL